MFVLKRNGEKEQLNINKIHKVCEFACENITGVSVSEIELKSKLQFHDNIKTSDIQETLIKAAAELIIEDTPNYQYVAGRLINYGIRKQVFGSYSIPSLYDHVCKIIDLGYYDKELLFWYTKSEFDYFSNQIKHDRDENISYAGMEQLRSKYLVKNRVTKELFETPQIAFMLISMMFFHNYSKKERLDYVVAFYEALSNFEISLPTPIMAGLRTPQKQFSSCVVMSTDDSLDSINATASSIVKYVSQKAGIGIDVRKIRAKGDKIRNGDTAHTGMIPFLKYFNSAVHSCSQGGVRGGSATVHFPLIHYEIEDLLVLKNNKGTEETRIRHMDYSIVFNKIMYNRLLNGENITLFSPYDVPDLFDAYYRDNNEFEVLYNKYEKDNSLKKKTLNALDLFSKFMIERKETGRIYLLNIDHVNDHGSFIKDKALITQSNLCQEVTLPTNPLNKIDDENGEISLCTLAAINCGKIKSNDDFKRLSNLLVRALDELLDYQNYPILAAKNSTLNRRPLGIGVINFAYWMAKNDLSYQNISSDGLNKIHEFFEAWSYYLIEASVNLAKEKGSCEKNNDTKYSLGILPIDTYKKDVDELAEPIYFMNWDFLRSELKKYGIRNSTLMALMPSETSSQIANATNGIEPPRALISIKQSKDGVLKQVVPEIKKLKNKYDLLWDQKSPVGYLKISAVINKFIDQSISTNTSYNPKYYDDEQIPMSVMLYDLLLCYKYGIKTLYYFNTMDGAGEIIYNIKNIDNEDCDSCKI